MNAHLLRKYNVPGPRYTSYPTVPHWNPEAPEQVAWAKEVNACFTRTNSEHGISLYIHLPYCESLCTYCACNTRITVNHAVETPYIDALLAEWAHYLQVFGAKPKLRELHLGGGTPTFFSPENLHRLISSILSTVEVHPSHEFSFEGHPANTSMEHLQTLFGLGFRRVSYGIQDFDGKVQEAIHRIQTAAQVTSAVGNARSAGFASVNFDLVYGLPFQTRASMIRTLREALALRPERIAFYGYAHVPWVKPGQRKFTEADLPLNEEKHALYQLGREMMLKEGYKDIGMDHFALPTDNLHLAAKQGKLHRNFMGYTPGHTELLIGLGTSAISDAWTAFAQNRKTVEEYIADVKAGILPIFKGHQLSPEDLVLRRHILNLMCQFKTDWSAPIHQTPSLEAALLRLKPLEADGLVQLTPHSVSIPPKGRPFVRNVCMAFDSHLHSKTQHSQVFSATV